MTLGDIHRLSNKDVRSYYKRYEMVSGQQVYNTLVKGSLGIFSKVISHVVPIDDPQSLSKDLQDDQLIRRELSSFAGYLILKGGRLVALASGLLQVAKHVNLDEIMIKNSGEKEITTESTEETTSS